MKQTAITMIILIILLTFCLPTPAATDEPAVTEAPKSHASIMDIFFVVLMIMSVLAFRGLGFRRRTWRHRKKR